MTADDLDRLVGRLEDRARRSAAEPDRDVEVTVVSCSMGPPVSGGSLWPVEAAAAVASVRTLGNQTWTHRDGHRCLDESLGHLLSARDVEAVVVVGHTECSVVADAHERHLAGTESPTAGMAARFDTLVALVEDAVEAGIVESTNTPRTARRRLVEYNVVRQVSFLAGSLPSSVTVAGYVFDECGAYDGFPGGHYLVALDGESSTPAVRSLVPDGTSVGGLVE